MEYLPCLADRNERGEGMTKRKEDWYDKFFTGLYGKVLAGQFDSDTGEYQAKTIKKLLRLRKGQSALDVPCGKGRMTIPLAKSGVRMTGVDLTESYIRKAKKDAKSLGQDIRFVCSDMRDIDFENEFNGAFNWFGSFAYFSDKETLEFCRSVHRALKPGGRFIVEGVHKCWIVRHFRPVVEHNIGGVVVKAKNRFCPKTGRVEGKWTFRKGKQVDHQTSSMRIFDASDLRPFLRKAGFRNIEFYGGGRMGEADKLTRHSRRMIAVGQK
jgi:ubiquinone/menaquinone biosynthesis C-methylase UbiE